MNNYRYGCSAPPMRSGYDRCGCPCGSDRGSVGALPEAPVVAMAYVPFQTDADVYPVEKALLRGTAFPALDKPFLAGCLQ